MTARLQPKTTRGHRGLLSSEDNVTRKKTYTNTEDRTRLLVEVGKSRLTKDGIEVRNSDPPHGHPVKAGESVMLSRGVRRVWREI
jgi:hypothetical protein